MTGAMCCSLGLRGLNTTGTSPSPFEMDPVGRGGQRGSGHRPGHGPVMHARATAFPAGAAP